LLALESAFRDKAATLKGRKTVLLRSSAGGINPPAWIDAETNPPQAVQFIGHVCWFQDLRAARPKRVQTDCRVRNLRRLSDRKRR
jgi:hypothetical protein